MKIKKNTANFGMVFLAVFFFFFFAITFESLDVLGVNNMSTITTVNVTNTPPNIYSVTLAAITLTPGNISIVNCTGIITDSNGWDDVNITNATIYNMDSGDGSTFDNNFRYVNRSCSCVATSHPENASCSCLFPVWYYADNGSWQCNMTTYDKFGLTDIDNSSGVLMSAILGINSEDTIDYGQLSVSETSSVIAINISNFGNIPFNVSIRQYAGTTDPSNPLNNTMECESGNITRDYQSFSVDNVTFFNSTNTTRQINLTLPVRTDDVTYGNDTNSTFWKLEIPLGVSGVCNGTIEFLAIDSS